MSPEKQRIAIAEACGWREMPIGGLWQLGDTDHYAQCDRNTEHNCTQLPDYLNDLSAIYDAEQKLWSKDWTLRHKYVDNLARILDPIFGYRNQSGEDLLDATAAQRACAFLRTIGKWEDDK